MKSLSGFCFDRLTYIVANKIADTYIHVILHTPERKIYEVEMCNIFYLICYKLSGAFQEVKIVFLDVFRE